MLPKVVIREYLEARDYDYIVAGETASTCARRSRPCTSVSAYGSARGQRRRYEVSR
ncbi:MAG: hypothetical protein Q8P31_02280 [Bacillota bacterium]|nr:hypothetical protein [Bacillota bacterium]